MEWTSSPVYKENDTRNKIIFAIIPHRCADGKTRWLEKIMLHERFGVVYDGGDGRLGWIKDSYDGI